MRSFLFRHSITVNAKRIELPLQMIGMIKKAWQNNKECKGFEQLYEANEGIFVASYREMSLLKKIIIVETF